MITVATWRDAKTEDMCALVYDSEHPEAGAAVRAKSGMADRMAELGRLVDRVQAELGWEDRATEYAFLRTLDAPSLPEVRRLAARAEVLRFPTADDVTEAAS